MDYTVRAASAEDQGFLQQLFADVHSPDFAPLQLPPAALSQLLEMQFRAQQSGYEQQFGELEDSILLIGPYPVGRLLVHAGASEIRLVDIALLSAFRGNGIGRRVLEGLQGRSGASEIPLRLSVRPENPAVKLYLRMGFVPRGGDGLHTEMEWSAEARGLLPLAFAQDAASVSPNGPMEWEASSAYFRGVTGQRLVVRALDPSAELEVELRLVSVNPLTMKQIASVEAGDSFVLMLEGPETAMLGQGMYDVRFEDGFRLELFFGPVSCSGGVVHYESVFNRMVLRERA